MNELQLKVEKLKSRIPAAFGHYIDVDEGWYQIVVNCDAEISEIDPNYRILQVKQKFGTLRYYTQMSDVNDKLTREQSRLIVFKAEALSAVTCEATGENGVLMKSANGWLKTLNPEYAKSKLHYEKYVIVGTN